MVRRAPALMVAICLLSYVFVVGSATAHGIPDVRAPMTPERGSRIQHVVIIYQENHTFDDVLGVVCGQRSTPCNGYTGPVTFADGITVPNREQPDMVPLVMHEPPAQRHALRNQWDH